MTTDPNADRAKKLVRARNLVDPLGAMGFRSNRERMKREARVRRMAFAVTTSCFAIIFGGIVLTNPGGDLGGSIAGSIEPRSVAERLLPPKDDRPAVITEQRSAPQPHTRTRGS